MKKAVIGITPAHDDNGKNPRTTLNLAYLNAISNAGAIPYILPIEITEEDFSSLFERVDGILFSGGGDLNPALFGAEMRYEISGIDTSRDEMEIALLKYVVEKQVPFLAICRGFEIMNVGLGGTLYTHIADQLPDALFHPCFDGLPRNLLSHTVAVEENSRLAKIFGSTQVSVNSLHHQGVKDVPPQLKATVIAPDKLVEGLELPDHPFGLGVQWHPEELTDSQPMLNLFKAFVESAETARG